MNPNYPGKSRDMTVPYMIVLASGLATTALTLRWCIGSTTMPIFNLMGFYLDTSAGGCDPGGHPRRQRLRTGLVVNRVKIPRTMIWTVLALQCIAYSARSTSSSRTCTWSPYTNQPVGFLQYFDWAARNFSFKKHNGEPGERSEPGDMRTLSRAGRFAFAGVLIPRW